MTLILRVILQAKNHMAVERVYSRTAFKMADKKERKEEKETKMKETILRLFIGARFVIHERELCCKSYTESYCM